MKKSRKVLRKILRFFLWTVLVLVILLSIFFFGFCNSLWGVDAKTVAYYEELQDKLVQKGYRDRLLVISGYRWKWWNNLLATYGGASKQSRHMHGEAIDILVYDVNKDGKADAKDVDIVYQILDQEIIGNKGGIGTYKNEAGFYNRQMVHFDCRGYWARWHR